MATTDDSVDDAVNRLRLPWSVWEMLNKEIEEAISQAEAKDDH